MAPVSSQQGAVSLVLLAYIIFGGGDATDSIGEVLLVFCTPLMLALEEADCS